MTSRRTYAAVTVRMPLDADRAWALLTDVRNHARWIPWTTVAAEPDLVVGDEFTGRTGPGRLALVDRMAVERLDPPTPARGGVAVYRKLGPVLLGGAAVHVLSLGPTSCQVTWLEDVHLGGLPRRLTAPALRPFLALMTRLALRRMAAEAA